MLTFEQRLQQLIDALGLTPARFGEVYGINRVSIHKMLQGQTKPSLDTIEKICINNPNISADFLIRGAGSPIATEKVKEPAEPNETLKLIFEIQSHMNTFLLDKVKDVSTTPEEKAREINRLRWEKQNELGNFKVV